MELERIKDGLEEEVQTIRSAQAERRIKERACRAQGEDSVVCAAATGDASASATGARTHVEPRGRRRGGARSELEQTQNAAARTISELRQKVVCREGRGASGGGRGRGGT